MIDAGDGTSTLVQQGLRVRSAVRWLLVLDVLLFVAIWLGALLGVPMNGAFLGYIFLALATVFVPSAIYLSYMRCPRCGKRFVHSANQMTSACANCGVKLDGSNV